MRNVIVGPMHEEPKEPIVAKQKKEGTELEALPFRPSIDITVPRLEYKCTSISVVHSLYLFR